MPTEPWQEWSWIAHSQRLLDSYRYWVGVDLVPRNDAIEDQSRLLFEAPFVLLSHGTQPDPILNYGNRLALELFETDLASFLATPSRLTAEPVHRDERARLLERVAEHGYIDDYAGVRISARGRRFFIERATVWNVVDDAGFPAGQAASFSTWRFLDEAR